MGPRRIVLAGVLLALSTPAWGAGDKAPAKVCKPVVKEVEFASSDGLIVHATYSSPCAGASVVVLAHQMCKDRREWREKGHDWVGRLGAKGVATLAIDLRGHGKSTKWPDGSTHDLCKEIGDDASAGLYLGMVDDVKAAVAYARKVLGAPGVALVGASIGANAAIVTYADDPAIGGVIALSPGLDYRGVKTKGAVGRIGKHTQWVWFVAAKDDEDSAAAVKELQVDPAIGATVLPKGGHGNAMVDSDHTLIDVGVSFLVNATRPSAR